MYANCISGRPYLVSITSGSEILPSSRLYSEETIAALGVKNTERSSTYVDYPFLQQERCLEGENVSAAVNPCFLSGIEPKKGLLPGIVSQAVLVGVSTGAYAWLVPLTKFWLLDSKAPHYPSPEKVASTAGLITASSALVVYSLTPYSKKILSSAKTRGEKIAAAAKVAGLEAVLSIVLFQGLGRVYGWEWHHSLYVGAIRGATKAAPAGMINKRWGERIVFASVLRAGFNLAINTLAGSLVTLASERGVETYRTEMVCYGLFSVIASLAIYASDFGSDCKKT